MFNTVIRTQTSNELGYPVTRSRQRGAEPARSDSFDYNDRGELELALLGGASYHNAYDNIGNRTMALAHGHEYSYYSDNLNQYTDIGISGEDTFNPAYDADGNQTKIKSTTGIWNVEYNAENIPICFTSEDGSTVIECSYDYMGRRWYKKVTENGDVTQHEEYMYRGYLQVAAFDMLNNSEPVHVLLWDPTEPVATRPLSITRGNQTWYYGWDFNKNVTELFDEQGNIAATYDYSPYGELLAQPAPGIGEENPLRFSSECDDSELGLVYYNYRHYNPRDGRWISRDPIVERGGLNLYVFVGNKPSRFSDIRGLEEKPKEDPKKCSKNYIIGHSPKIKSWLEEFNKSCDICSATSANGCHFDGSNGNKGIPGFTSTPNDFFGVTFKPENPYCANGGYNPKPDVDTPENESEGFIKLVNENWEKTKKAAEKEAEDCKCDCKEIVARFGWFDPFSENQIKRIENAGKGTLPRAGDTAHYPCKKNKK